MKHINKAVKKFNKMYKEKHTYSLAQYKVLYNYGKLIQRQVMYLPDINTRISHLKHLIDLEYNKLTK